MFRLIAVSVRGPRYLDGNPSVHPIDDVPTGVGTLFATIDDVRNHVRREYVHLSAYWRVEVIDTADTVVMRGTRAGNAAGTNWIWEAM